MSKYIITINETLARDVVVEAEDELEALKIVEKNYVNGSIVLDAEDCVDAEIYVNK